MKPEVTLFVREALVQGHARDQISQELQAAGWTNEDIKSSLSAFAESDFPIPVPRRQSYTSAREAFLYLVMFMTLAMSAFALGGLFFQLINIYLPDPLAHDLYMRQQVNEQLRDFISTLLVAFPVFLYVSRIVRRALIKIPEMMLSRPRVILTYLALFIASGCVIGTLIAVLSHFLGGELTLRFGLKSLTILIIAGVLFGYYLSDLRRAEDAKK